MKDNLFNLMKDNDWKILKLLQKKPCKIFHFRSKFNKYWFKNKKWTVYIKKNKIKFICSTCLLF